MDDTKNTEVTTHRVDKNKEYCPKSYHNEHVWGWDYLLHTDVCTECGYFESLRPVGIWDRELTYEETHLPVTDELIYLALVDPSATYMNMEALYWSIINSPDPSLMIYLDSVSRRRAELVDKP